MEKIKIKWLKPHPGWAYFAGDDAEIEADKVEELIESGHVILYPGVDEKEQNPLPEDMPLRKELFAAGFDSVEKVADAGDSLLEIKGIGPKSFESLQAFLTR